MNELKVLVTGSGALLGQGILRTLRQVRGYKMKIIACDPDFRSSGNWLADIVIKIPLAKNKEYINIIERIIAEHKIDVLFIGTDVELFIISDHKNRLEEKYNVKIVVGHRESIEIGDDKWKTSEFLKINKFPYPYSALSIDKKAIEELIQDVGFPLIVKPRVGARSVGVYCVRNQTELDSAISNKTDLIIQECIGTDDFEYTAGTVTLNEKVVSCIVLRRDLKDGNTYRAYNDNNGKYNELIQEIALKLGIDGPCNFQFRLRDNMPVIFEINSRFSGTTPIRAAFGLNEVQIILDHLFKGETTIPKILKQGVVLRTISDVFVNKSDWDKIGNQQESFNPNGEFIPFNSK